MSDRDTEIAEYLKYRGLPPTASLKELIEHERVNAALAATFDSMKRGLATIKLTLPQLKALSAACDEYGTGLADNPGTGTELRVLQAAQAKVDQAMAKAMSANGSREGS